MSRVLHVVGRMDPGGTETLLINTYRHIDRGRIQFDFAVHSAQSGYFDEEIRSLGGRVFYLQRPHLTSMFQYTNRLRRLLHQQGPFTAVHSHVHHFSGCVLKVARAEKIRLRIAHSHTTNDGKPDGFLRSVYRRLMRMLILRNASHLFACSSTAIPALYGQSILDDPRVCVLPNAIDLRPYRNLPSDKEVLRKELSLPIGTPLIGHVGNFRPEKNHAFLIEVMDALLERKPAAHLLLVGDGPLRHNTEQMVRAKGIGNQVRFMGLRSDVPRILGALDLFLFPSLFEGLGIVLIEAQAAGIPCVTSDTIPGEADVGLGLILQASLQDGAAKWADLIASQLASTPVPWIEREAALGQAGYDIDELAERLCRIYTDV